MLELFCAYFGIPEVVDVIFDESDGHVTFCNLLPEWPSDALPTVEL